LHCSEQPFVVLQTGAAHLAVMQSVLCVRVFVVHPLLLARWLCMSCGKGPPSSAFWFYFATFVSPQSYTTYLRGGARR
jgi:hypothetical protein